MQIKLDLTVQQVLIARALQMASDVPDQTLPEWLSGIMGTVLEDLWDEVKHTTIPAAKPAQPKKKRKARK